jgi:glycosyltransferase involved in cell wall biosynthesis
MHVVFAVHQTKKLTGIQKYYYTLARELTLKGVEVSVIVDSPECASFPIFPALHPIVVQPYADTQFNTMQYCRNVSKQLQHMEFDIFHSAHILPYVYLHTKKHKSVVFQPFGNELFTLSGRGMNPVYCKLAQPILQYCGNNANILLSEGEFQSAEMARFYPKVKAVRVLPVGIDTDVPRKSSYKTGIDFKFLAVNNLLAYEGMDVLVEAFHDAWLYNGRMQLTIVGTGELEEQLREATGDIPVTFMKNVPEDELRKLYAASDAFVCTTRETDFQMSVLEAMAAGLPVISTELRWLPGNAETYNGSSTDLTSQLLAMSSKSNTKRIEMAAEGLLFIKDYDMKVVAEKAIEIYKELLSV